MKIQVNSKAQELKDEISLADLLVKNKVKMPEMVSVQINSEFIKRENFKTTIIKEDDTIDFLYFMGGG